jgi:biofilm protein TabA
MILDTLKLWPQYAGFSPHFKTAFEFLEKVDDRTPDGRIEIAGDDVFAIALKTSTSAVAGREYEVHRKYIDVQYIHRGREVMYWAPLSGLSKVTMPFDVEQDAALYALTPEGQPLQVSAGQFAIFFPEDAHIPSCNWSEAVEPVVKVVVKVRV